MCQQNYFLFYFHIQSSFPDIIFFVKTYSSLSLKGWNLLGTNKDINVSDLWDVLPVLHLILLLFLCISIVVVPWEELTTLIKTCTPLNPKSTEEHSQLVSDRQNLRVRPKHASRSGRSRSQLCFTAQIGHDSILAQV